jgi:membrane protease YdiL (CAAX protease family)
MEGNMNLSRLRLPRGAIVLLQIAILFLPSIPAYLWVWPNIPETNRWIAESLANCYAIAVSLFVGLRYWNLSQLGINKNGILFSLICGGILITGRALVVCSLDWGLLPKQLNFTRMVGEILFDLVLVGVGQELLFRGLIFRACGDWLGAGWAIIGSAVAFGLWHVFGQGPLVGLGTMFYGLVFALIRWRAGGIMGLILVHGLVDFVNTLMIPDVNTPVGIHSGWMLFVGLALILIVPVYLWIIYPRASKTTTQHC